MKQIINFCKNMIKRINWQPNVLTWIICFLVLATVPAVWIPFNPELFVENGWVENLQLIILSGAMIMALCARRNRPLFVFAGFVFIFLILRETNMFRDVFCIKYLHSGEMCRWEAFKYGYWAPLLRWLFAGLVACYVCYYRLWKIFWQYILKAPIYIWEFLFLGIAFIGGTIAEFACIDNEIMEESFELIGYLALANCIYRYQKIVIE